jgi:YebC/PmpR family DNA-binding regulatory protein
MSGHSKWATTKRRKFAVDAKRGVIFTKMAKNITVAAREKGGDPSANFTLRMAIDKARSVNMPMENIERAIKRGAGGADGAQIETLVYEGFGPAKSQFIVRCLSDNKNRTASEIRHLFSKFGGSFGSVAWNFSDKGVIRVTKESLARLAEDGESRRAGKKIDDFELELIDAGADDIIKEEEGVTIYTKPVDLDKVKTFLDQKNIAAEEAQVESVAKEEQNLSADDSDKVQAFIDALDEHEDVDEYYTNVNL